MKKERVLHPLFSGFLGTLASAFLAYVLYFAAGKEYAQYGYAVFIGLPFVMGFSSALFTSVLGDTLTAKRCMQSALWTIAVFGFILMFVGAEGLICLGMSLPIAVPLLLLGSYAGYGVRRYFWNRKQRMASVAIGVGLFPMLLSKDMIQPAPLFEHVESTILIINAPTTAVWPYVVRLKNLPPAEEWMFKAGIAHPIEVVAFGNEVGAKRECQLSTGTMPEIITKWEPNRMLEFKVISTPPSMKETNPFRHTDPPHLHGYYQCSEGQFRLEPLPHGKTKLTGTSWYGNRITPDFYWSLWTQSIVEHVHLRVMNVIKQRAEADSILDNRVR